MPVAAEPDPHPQHDGEERVALGSQSEVLLQKGLRRNFIRMSVFFSLNHACVTSALALSTANLGPVLGNASNAVLYVFYTCTALVYAGPHVQWRGSKAALVDSTCAFCVYVGSFYVAEVWASAAWGAALVGAAIGGVAAGILFTAQGVYFTLTARAYVQSSSRSECDSTVQGIDISSSASDDVANELGRRRLGGPDRAMEEATALFASTFAVIYLLCEITFKLIAWILPMYWPAGWAVVSLTYLATAVAAAAAMVSIWRLDAETDDSPFNVETSSPGSHEGFEADKTGNSSDVPHGVSASGRQSAPTVAVPQRRSPISPAATESDADAVRATGCGYFRQLLLLLCERQMLLAMGLNLASEIAVVLLHVLCSIVQPTVDGFTSAYLTSHINGTIVARAYGAAAIGLFSAITPTVAGLASPVLGFCSRSCKTKQPVMILGSVALVLVVVVPAIADFAGLWMLPNFSAEGRDGAASPIFGVSPMSSGTNSSAALLAVIYFLEGVGRGVFEGPNRSVYADWFENKREMAFACWIVQSGGSASIAFFMLAMDVPPSAVGALGLLCAALAAPGFVLGDRSFRQEERTTASLLARP